MSVTNGDAVERRSTRTIAFRPWLTITGSKAKAQKKGPRPRTAPNASWSTVPRAPQPSTASSTKPTQRKARPTKALGTQASALGPRNLTQFDHVGRRKPHRGDLSR